MSKLYIVGIGPGSEEYLTLKAKNIVESSDIVIGSKRALDLFKTDKKIELNAKNMQNMVEEAVQLVKRGKSVALLSTGDPGFSGILKPILKLNEDIDIEVIPGISSVQLCAAKLKIPWDDADLITLHGKGISEHILDVIDNGKPTIILPNFKPAELADFLIKNGVNEERKVAICERLSYDDEKVLETSIKDILEMEFSYMCVVVIY
ncbi:cobalt-precorrin-7 (C(5))-methyltransferase [Methanobacterium oryzae]|uniref:cobalt-precorrin-7 (C(5))-methyltransferase n=1 Tax=Methanobacterium oryzae TaxID=69540 RepID=UPI003D25E7B7